MSDTKQMWVRNADVRIQIWADGCDLTMDLKSSKTGINSLYREFEAFPKSGGCGTRVIAKATRLTVSYSSITVIKDNKEYSI